MTAVEVLVLQVGVDVQKARGEKPTIAGAVEVARDLWLAPLDACLSAEAKGDGHVEFRRGAPVWVAGPPRFRP